MARGLIALIAAVACAGLSACGFTPLYGEQGVAPGLSLVEVVAPEGRTSYLLRERLDDQLAHDRSTPPAYRLNYDLTEVRIPRGLGPDNAASRYELNVQVDWRLTALTGGSELRKGRTEVLVTYAAVDPPYGGIAAQEDGQQRAAGEAARRIRLELAQYFAARNTAPQAPAAKGPLIP